MSKLFNIMILVLFVVSYPLTAKADKEFIQKIQEKVQNIQQKATSALEEVQKYKNELQEAATKAQGMAGQIQQGVKDAKNGKQPQIQQMTLGNTSKTDIKGDAEKADQAIEADYISEQGGDDTTEKFNKAQEKAQEVLREAVSQLYAIGFTTRTNMTKETPTDNAMKASDQILQETNTKAMKCVQRLAAIYTLESMIQSYQMLENMQSVIIDASQEEKKEGDN